MKKVKVLVTQLCLTFGNPMACKPTSILCHLLLLQPSIFPSIRVISNNSALPIRWQKDWSFSFTSALPMNTLD